LFEITPSNDGLLDSQLPQIAQDIGLDRDDFMECLESGRYAQKVQSHVNQAVAAGGQGTPYSVIVVGDEKIPVSEAVPYSQLKAIIDSVL
jgi:predicted DsbA family dithiol-disulfide isomerase